MRRKKRENNAFSTSAVDLFASAMGAFILLAVIALPFFPKTSLAPPQPCPPVPQCEVCQECPICPVPQTCPVCKTCPPVPDKPFALKDTDLVIVLDITGSMEDFIEALKSTSQDLSALLAHLAPSFGIGMVTFGDYGFDQPTQVFPLREIRGSRDKKAFEDFVNDVEVNLGIGRGKNNTDGEALSAGLQAAVEMTFRAASKDRRVIIFTDDVPSYESRAMRLARDFAAASRGGVSQTVSVVAVVATGNVGSDKAEVLERIADQGNGLYSEAAGSIIGKLLLALLAGT